MLAGLFCLRAKNEAGGKGHNRENNGPPTDKEIRHQVLLTGDLKFLKRRKRRKVNSPGWPAIIVSGHLSGNHQ